jgi:WD40 repeat protein
LALASQSGLRLWEVATGKERLYHPARRNPFYCIAFSPDGRTLAAGLGGIVRLWDVATGRELLPIPGQRDRIGFVRLSADGRTVTTLPGEAGETNPGGDTTLRYWDAHTGMELAPPPGQDRTFPAFDSLTGDADLSADGKTLASLGKDSAVHLWDVASGKELHKIPYEGEAVCQFSPDGELVLLRSRDRKARDGVPVRGEFWQVKTGKSLGQFETLFGPVVFSPDGKLLAYRSFTTVYIVDVSTHRELRRIETDAGAVQVITFSPDGKTLAGTGRRPPENRRPPPEIRMWDVATGAQKASLATEQFKEKHRWLDYKLVFTPDGKSLVTSDGRGQIFFWNAATGTLRLELATGQSSLIQLAFSADGDVMLTADFTTGLVWNVRELLKENR